MRVDVRPSPSPSHTHHDIEEPATPAPSRTTLSEPRGPKDGPPPADPPSQPDPDASGASPDRGALWSFLTDVLGAIGSVIEGSVDAVFGVCRSIAGLFTHPSRVPGELAENVSGAVILVGGKAIGGVQTLLGLEAAGRRLTEDEVMALRSVFGDSIDFGRVRIKEGSAGLFSTNERPFAHGNVIYTKDRAVTPELLAHELVHVWQYQNGGADYMSESLAAQAFGDDAYGWQKAVADGKSWEEMGPEQQAELIGVAFSAGFFAAGELEGNQSFVVDGVDYTAFLRAALVELRAGRGAP